MLALSPFIIFMVVYLVGSLIAGDFYELPLTVAFLIASAYAIGITPKIKLRERINIFSRGAGDENIMLMIWIFVLAGAFATTASKMGAIDATVNLTLRLLPASMLLPGLFLAACFISLSIGTSVGTVVALTPVAVGIAEQTGFSLPMIVALVVGGAFFGDNLSFISDTTIVATQTQGCKMNDKFKANIWLAAPAAILVLVAYIFIGQGVQVPEYLPELEWYKVIPYVAVLVMAIVGVNVLIVLFIGILLAGIIGIATGSFDTIGWMGAMGNGIMGMSELIIVTLLAGGMLALIRHNGGIEYLIHALTKRIRGKRGAKCTIALLVILADMCTANNTIALVTVGPMAKEIADKYGIDKRISASLLDTFSCFTQGFLPYGAQLLMAAGLAQITPFEITAYLYYPLALGLMAVLGIVFDYPRRYRARGER
jgi:Na+/H+ antiporter NhaC